MTCTAAAVFVAVAALDFVWAYYTRYVNDGRAVCAGFAAILIMLLGGTAVIGYTADPWMLIPAGVGAFVGTFTAVKMGAK
jgi:hypothetical protein